ncbi:MAG: hypothetical protein K2I18_08175 [Paramuribaculum sp.]|nr:hypothetical protein [Paramuribaculum sp.]
MEKILVGSRAFFGEQVASRNKGKDYVELVYSPKVYKWRWEMCLRGTNIFRYKKEDVKTMVQRTVNLGDPQLIGKFLVPEFATAINAKVGDILPLEVLLPKLTEKQKYIALIFEAIKENNTFELEPWQLNEAYEVYKQSRQCFMRNV